MGVFWHPECFRCHACDLPISDYEFSINDNRPFHKSCYKDLHHPKCEVCKNFIPTNAVGLIEYRAHPFWKQKYCPSHEHDETPRCCSCERMEVEQQVTVLLVERQALNESTEGEETGHNHQATIGLCLSEEQTVNTILRRPKIGGYRITDMSPEPYTLVRKCEVTAILILYGLPRLLTGLILAHEMMHAWLRLKGYPNLSPKVERGICHVLAHLWLDSEINAASATSSSSGSSKKGKKSEFEKKLCEWLIQRIESDTSAVYGDGFREGNKAVLKYGLRRTLDHIRLKGSFPC
ncbi:protein DA1-related 1-like isoform X1 [Salvia splendens]|uniref:protein DA1-related 1-like isoform X1 n=1 Tax=Salvia splendens TaxID=180675 RepID=UPI001C2572CE|nr:protein DA1-related 1-like isoform X1 [Salvia splendens]